MRSSQRRGSAYVVVLGTAMIVSTIGLTALLALRVERRTQEDDGDLLSARLNAKAAIEVGMQRIVADANWRTTYPSGVWEASRRIGSGSYTLSGTDPDDGSLADMETDPVVLTATATSGRASHTLQVTLAAQTVPLGCLGVSLHANNDVFFTSATVQSNQTISANNSVSSNTSTVAAAVEAVNAVNGTGYTGTTTIGVAPRSVPNPTTVFDYYKSNGTPIAIALLPLVAGVRTIGETLLSPAANPFGPTNAEGIYVLDCQSQMLHVRNSRIVGTLVVLNAGSGSAVYGSVNWEPAVANYPALMVQGAINLVYTATELSESVLGKNLNPAGTPYLGASDVDTTDTYPSRIKGIVYGSVDIGTSIGSLPSAPSPNVAVALDGVLVVGVTLNFSNPSPPDAFSLSLTYLSTFYDDPPPGFREVVNMVVLPGSWKQVVP
ncbi:MAG: hypothetical protein AABZ12_00110 [Planctomycetota bacterium]